MLKFTSLVVFELTRDCNANCIYCFNRDKKEFAGEVIEYKTFKCIFDHIIYNQCIKNDGTPLNISLHGGEFMLLSDELLYGILEYITTISYKYNIKIFLSGQTNGINISDSKLELIKKYMTNIGISFDGFSGCNEYRNIDERIYINLFNKLNEAKISYGVICVVHNNNIDKLENDLEKELKIPANFTYLPYENPTNDNEFLAKIDVTNDIFDKVYKRQIYNFIHDKPHDVKFRLYIQRALIDFISAHDYTYKSGCGGKICGTAIGMIAIRPNGSIGYCDRWTHETEENHIMNAWDYDFLGAKQLRHAIDIDIKKHNAILQLHCDTCPADYFCKHGCLTFDYSIDGKWELSDRDCKIYRPMYYYIKDNLIDIFITMSKNNVELDVIENIYYFKTDVINMLKQYGITIKYDKENNKIKILQEDVNE